MVRNGGFEPPRSCDRQPLKRDPRPRGWESPGRFALAALLARRALDWVRWTTMDLLNELAEVQAEAPEAVVYFAVQYPTGRAAIGDLTDPDALTGYQVQIQDGAARLLTIYAFTPGAFCFHQAGDRIRTGGQFRGRAGGRRAGAKQRARRPRSKRGAGAWSGIVGIGGWQSCSSEVRDCGQRFWQRFGNAGVGKGAARGSYPSRRDRRKGTEGIDIQPKAGKRVVLENRGQGNTCVGSSPTPSALQDNGLSELNLGAA